MLAAYKPPGKEAAVYELVDVVRACSSIHEVGVTTLLVGSLGTRPFAVRRKGLGTRVHPSCPQDGMLT